MPDGRTALTVSLHRKLLAVMAAVAVVAAGAGIRPDGLIVSHFHVTRDVAAQIVGAIVGGAAILDAFPWILPFVGTLELMIEPSWV